MAITSITTTGALPGAGAITKDPAAGDGGKRRHRVVDRNIQLQIPAPGAGGVKAADVGEFGIQRVDEGLRLVVGEIEGAGIGEDDALVVKAQVDRVGAQPVAGARFVAAFAEQTQGGEGAGGDAEAVGQHAFERMQGATLKAGAGEQPFETRCRELAEGELVGRLGPDQFGDKQGEMHGNPGQLKMSGRAKSVP